MSGSGNDDLRGTIAGLIVLGVIGYGIWAGVSWGKDKLSDHAADPRDQEIKELKARIDQLEAKPKEHHYELRNDGLRTFRFDPETGDTCIQLTTKDDWKRTETIRQGCPYNDFLANHQNDPKAYDKAECWYVNSKSACDRF